MRSFLAIGVMLALAAAAATAQDNPQSQPGSPGAVDPMEVLRKTDAACKAVSRVHTEATFRGIGPSEFQVPRAKATVILDSRLKAPNDIFNKGFVDGKLEPPGGGKEARIQLGSDGETFFLIDAENKTVHEDIATDVFGMRGLQFASMLVMREYVHPTPFSDELGAQKVELRSDSRVGDEDCYQIRVVYAGNFGEATWFLSKKDYLPRRVDRTPPSRGADQVTTSLEVTKLVLDPKIEEGQFKPRVPDDFKKTSDPPP